MELVIKLKDSVTLSEAEEIYDLISDHEDIMDMVEELKLQRSIP